MRYKLLNTEVDSLDKKDTIDKIIYSIEHRKRIYQVSINADKVNLIEDSPKLKEIISQADLINADGISIVWAAKILKVPIKHRVTGVDLFYELLEISDKKRYSIYFLGATQESLENMISIIKQKYPLIEVAGYHNGYFEDNQPIIDEIQLVKPDILFLGFSSPQKEFWIEKYKDIVRVAFIMGVGGSFDVYSGKTKRAPKFMQEAGLEWLYRFIQEPRRMFRRYIFGNIEFTKKVIKEKFKWIF